MKFPWLSTDQIEAAAAGLLREAYPQGVDRSAPVDLHEVVFEFLCDRDELSIDDEADLGFDGDDSVLGITRPIAGQILLSRVLKQDSDPGRARFTLAHEIGHWILHRPFVRAQLNQNEMFASPTEHELVGTSQSIFPRSATLEVREEWQANRFAAALLIDRSMMRREFIARFERPFVARQSPEWLRRSTTLRAHSRLLASSTINRCVPLRSVFGVSIEAMAIALETNGYSIDELPML